MSFDNMGKPIPFARRHVAHMAMRAMGVASGEAFTTVQAVAEQLEKDRPLPAMEAARKAVDLTGAYRLFAHLLTPCDAENGSEGVSK